MGENNTVMQVNYNKLFLLLKKRGLTQQKFKMESNISGSTLTKLSKNQNMNTENICRICDYFHCMPDDIMEWIPEPAPDENAKEKAELQSQIAELQAKLEKL